MINKLISQLATQVTHTPRIALVRLLLALSMLLTLLANDMSVVANHSYHGLDGYHVRHTAWYAPLSKADIFMVMPPADARLVVIAVLLLVMTGLVPQITGLLHVWVGFSIHNYFLVLNSGDELTYILPLLLLPLCLTDPRLNQWRRVGGVHPLSNIVAWVVLWAVRVQAAIMYFDACVAKLWSPYWRNGTAVYYYTSHYRLGATGWLRTVNEWLTLSPVVYLLTWGVLLFELALVACLFMPLRIRRRFFWPAVAFHFLIVINFGLITFFIAILALLILFLSPDISFRQREIADGG